MAFIVYNICRLLSLRKKHFLCDSMVVIKTYPSSFSFTFIGLNVVNIYRKTKIQLQMELQGTQFLLNANQQLVFWKKERSSCNNP
jgi:hypothetical protein